MRLKDKVAIVTGGARGIGAAFCEGLAVRAPEWWFDVLDGSAVAERITESQQCAIFVRAHVLQKVRREFCLPYRVRIRHRGHSGQQRGAVADLHTKPFQEIDEDEWDRAMAVNVRGTFQCAKAVAPVMIGNKKGRIVNLASGTAFKGTRQSSALCHVQRRGGVDDTLACARKRSRQHLCQRHRAGPDHERSGQGSSGLNR